MLESSGSLKIPVSRFLPKILIDSLGRGLDRVLLQQPGRSQCAARPENHQERGLSPSGTGGKVLQPVPLALTHTDVHTHTLCLQSILQALSEGAFQRESEQVIPTLKLPIIPSCFHNKFQTPYYGIQGLALLPHPPSATSALTSTP